MRYAAPVTALLRTYASVGWTHTPPLLPESEVAALVNELSGETARINLDGIAHYRKNTVRCRSSW